jgi:RND family efflux transporter MFP subunit
MKLTLPIRLLALCVVTAQPFAVLGAPPATDTGFQPVIVVEAGYPGANSSVLADTVAAPIEQQVNGVERLKRMVSRCTDDGRYTLLLSFDSAVDLDLIQVMIQNRVSLALPIIPAAVQNAGISVRKLFPGARMVIVLTSPDASRDALYLGHYAATQIKDELARLAGVGEVAILGGGEVAVRITLDPEKLAALNLTPDDVLKALRAHHLGDGTGAVDASAAKGTTPLQFGVGSHGRAADPKLLDGIVVKATAGGGNIYLRDVGRVELGRAPSKGDVSFDGRPAVALVVSLMPAAKPREVNAAVRERMGRLKDAFPPGLDYVVALDHAAPSRCLLAEPIPPAATSAARSQEIRNQYAAILAHSVGVRHVLSLPEDPFARFTGGPCVVATFDETGKQSDWPRSREQVRAQLERQVRSADPRLRELSGQGGGYPVELALCGPDIQSVREFGRALAARLSQSGKMSDVAAGPRVTTRLDVEIDRDKSAALGVSLADIRETLRLAMRSTDLDETAPFGRSAHIRVQLDTGPKDTATDLMRLKVRGASGQMVPLSTLAAVRTVEAPGSVERVDLRPSLTVSANPAAGLSLAEARWLCETLAERVRTELRLPADYGLVWLQELPAPKPIPGELKPGPESPPEVTVARPVAREVTDYQDFTGRIDAAESAELRARVTGYLVKTIGQEGTPVKKGDLLFEIDPRPYQALLDLSKAELELAKARLKLAEASRTRLLAAKPGKAELDEAQAAVDEAKSRLAVAEAVFARHRLDLEFCRITAPIDGVVGRNYATIGNLVTQDNTVLSTIVGQGRMYVYFDVDERTFLNLRQAIKNGKIKTRRATEQPVAVGLANDEGFPHQGKLDFVDNRVDPQTGSLRMRAVLADARQLLKPGLFARVRLTVGEPRQALLVPEEAIGSDLGRKFVYVVDDANKAASRVVTLGTKHDGLRVVETGLRPDDRVIVEGAARVRAGQTVKPAPEQR